MAEPRKNGLLANWKCLAACTLVSMCPFQYGMDFGLIGGLQAMIGFLKVRKHFESPTAFVMFTQTKVFGHPADTIIGWNISPGRQQLISSLMTLGAFISSSAAGKARED